MKEKIFKEDFQKLDEFLHQINQIVTPLSFREELKAVMDPQTRKNLCEKYPKCFYPVRIGNKDNFILPICNRNGSQDKNMVAFAMKFANRLLGKENVDRGMLEITIKNLDELQNSIRK